MIADLKPYSAMKDSGVERLGEVTNKGAFVTTIVQSQQRSTGASGREVEGSEAESGVDPVVVSMCPDMLDFRGHLDTTHPEKTQGRCLLVRVL